MNISIVIPLIIAVIVWALNEYSKRQLERHKNKAQRYSNLLKNIQGFTVTELDYDKINDFIKEFNLSWQYCPDSVILKGKQFINSVHTHNSGDITSNQALGEFIIEIRKDLLGSWYSKGTKLKREDFELFRANLTSPS